MLLLRESLPILLSQWETAGRWRVRLQEIPLDQLAPAPPQVKTIRDTVASPRLDAVLAAPTQRHLDAGFERMEWRGEYGLEGGTPIREEVLERRDESVMTRNS